MDSLSDISHEKTLMWLKKENLKREIESLLIAAQKKKRHEDQLYQRRSKIIICLVIETKRSIT